MVIDITYLSSAEKICFSQDAVLSDNHSFTLNTDNLISRLIRSFSLLVVALFFLSGHWANSDPLGVFLKKVCQSISKALQPQPTHHQPKSDRNLPKKRSLCTPCRRIQPCPRQKQKEICPMEFRSQAGKAWSQVLI